MNQLFNATTMSTVYMDVYRPQSFAMANKIVEIITTKTFAVILIYIYMILGE